MVQGEGCQHTMRNWDVRVAALGRVENHQDPSPYSMPSVTISNTT